MPLLALKVFPLCDIISFTMRRLLFFLPLLCLSCNYGFYLSLFNEESADSRAKTLTILSSDDTPQIESESFSFVVVTDVHFGAASERHNEAFFAKLDPQLAHSDETKRPRFLVCLGDSADGGHEVEYKEYNSFLNEVAEHAERISGEKNFKSYTIMGNHDTYNNGWEEFKKLVFPNTSFYTFSLSSTAAPVTFFFLDTANGTLGDSQRELLQKSLVQNENMALVFSHYPIYAGGNLLYTEQDTTERALLLTWFAKYNVKAVFAGHAHKNYSFDSGDFTEDVTASYLYQRYFRLVTVNTAEKTVSSELIEF